MKIGRLVLLTSIIALFSVSFALAQGCCTNPAIGNAVCSDDQASEAACCPGPASNPSYYGSPGLPIDQADCRSNFFNDGQSCASVGSCIDSGCCCQAGGFSQTASYQCSGDGSAFFAGSACSAALCNTATCNDNADNDFDTCIDAADPDCAIDGPGQETNADGQCLGGGAPVACDNPTFQPQAAVTGAALRGQKEVVLSWVTTECDSQYQYADVHRCRGSGCSNFQKIGTTDSKTFNDLDPELLWDTDYRYKVELFYNGLSFTQSRFVGVNIGNIECWNVLDSNAFCIQPSYYDQFRNYMLANGAAFPGFTDANFYSKVEQQYGAHINTIASCNGANTLTFPAGNQCSGNQFCGNTQTGAECFEQSACGADFDNLFGLFFNNFNRQSANSLSCENKNGERQYCFFDASDTSVDYCYACSNRMSCFDYKSEDSCTANACGVTGQCQWKDQDAELGTGMCVDADQNNCRFCDQSGTSGLETSGIQSQIFSVCTPEKAGLLSTPAHQCLFDEDSKTAVSCAEIQSCTEYTLSQCTTDFCGLSKCARIGNSCRKDANGDGQADCSPNDQSCEADLFAPDTQAIVVQDAGGVDDKVLLQITDQVNKNDAAQVQDANNYFSFICNVGLEQCNDLGDYTKNIVADVLEVVNLELVDATTGTVLYQFNGDTTETFRVYTADNAGNVEAQAEEFQITFIEDSSGPVFFALDLAGDPDPLDDVHITNQLNPAMTIEFAGSREVFIQNVVAIDLDQSRQIDFTLTRLTNTLFGISPDLDITAGSYRLVVQAFYRTLANTQIFMDPAAVLDFEVDDSLFDLQLFEPSNKLILDDFVDVNLSFGKEAVFVELFFDGTNISDQLVSPDDKDFTAQLVDLAEGGHGLTVDATDYFNNRLNASIVFGVDATPITINFTEPTHGVSPTNVFDVTVVTDGPANCVYTTREGVARSSMDSFEQTGDRTHTLTGFSLAAEEVEFPFIVSCEDLVHGDIVEEQFTIMFDSTPPEFVSAFADPNPVIDVPRTSSLRVQLSDESLCKYDTQAGRTYDTMTQWFNASTTGEFHDTFTQEVTVPSDGTYSFYVACESKAELQSPVEEIQLIANSTVPLQITSNMDPFYQDPVGIELNVQTNKETICYYGQQDPELDPAAQIISSTRSYNHKLLLGLTAGGDYSYMVNCFEQNSDGSLSNAWGSAITVAFTIDSTGPEMLYVNDTSNLANNPERTFETDYIRANWLAEDLESDIVYYNYTIIDRSTRSNIIEWVTTTKDGAWRNIPDQVLNLTNGRTYFARFFAVNKLQLASPVLDSDGVTVDFSLIPPTCSDGIKNRNETDIDCGGECGACGENQTCFLESDCEPGLFCSSLGVCAGPSCTDGIKNGAETDIDCGGACGGCRLSETCIVDSDCEDDFVCKFSTCSLPDPCEDGVLSPSETGIDCGGSCPNKCASGQGCFSKLDCAGALSCIQSYCKVCAANDADCDGVPDLDLDGDGEIEDIDDEDVDFVDPFDKDGDRCKDTWEVVYGLDPNDPTDCDEDYDGDGLSNYIEYTLLTDPNLADSDRDGVPDQEEYNLGTDPLDADSKPKGGGSTLLLWFLILLVLAGCGFGGYYYYQEMQRNTAKQSTAKSTISLPPTTTAPVQRAQPRISPAQKKTQEQLFKKRTGALKNQRNSLIDAFNKSNVRISKQPIKKVDAPATPSASPHIVDGSARKTKLGSDKDQEIMARLRALSQEDVGKVIEKTNESKPKPAKKTSAAPKKKAKKKSKAKAKKKTTSKKKTKAKK